MKRKALAMVAVVYLGLGTLAYRCVLQCNATPSAPIGCYWIGDERPVVGEYAAACAPDSAVVTDAKARGYLPSGDCPPAMLLKVVAAQHGDVVDIGPEGVRVNGALWPASAQVRRNSLGQTMPRLIVERRRLKRGEVLLMSDRTARGFDGRYFGVTSRADIVGRARPLLTWN